MMEVYCLRNDKGEYVSMAGTLTPLWLEASKFGEESIQRRLNYLNDEFKLVKFEVKEVY